MLSKLLIKYDQECVPVLRIQDPRSVICDEGTLDM